MEAVCFIVFFRGIMNAQLNDLQDKTLFAFLEIGAELHKIASG
jgi:hypothetical protein